MDSAMVAFCSTSSTLVPVRVDLHDQVADLLPTRCGARPRLGSSSSRYRGRDISARPIASICCSPPDRYPAVRLRRCASTGNRP